MVAALGMTPGTVWPSGWGFLTRQEKLGGQGSKDCYNRSHKQGA